MDYTGQGVGHGKSEIIMAVNGPNGLIGVIDVFTQITNKSAELGRNCVSDGIRNIDRRCAFANRRFNDAVKEFRLRARSVFARKLDIVGVFLCDANGFNSTKDYPKIRQALGVRALKVYATGNNLLTFTDLLEGDPENKYLVWGQYPQMMTVKLGIQVSF